jgi:aspartate/methionine/tyrosine aminotransferase
VPAGPGDEVLRLEPAYTTSELDVAAAGATAGSVPLDPATGFDLDVDAVAMTPRTAAVIVDSPANPSGAVFDHAALARLTAACAEHGAWCVAGATGSSTPSRRHVGLRRRGRHGLDGEAFADALLDAERIVVVPGSGFGTAARHGVRLAPTVDEDRLAAAAARMRRLVAGRRPQPD